MIRVFIYFHFLYIHKYNVYRYTCTHNWSLKAFTQDYGLSSHTTHVECFNFILEWRGLQFNIDSEQHSFKKLSHSRLVNSIRKSPRKYFFFFHIPFWCLTWHTTPDFTPNKPTQYLRRLLYIDRFQILFRNVLLSHFWLYDTRFTILLKNIVMVDRSSLKSSGREALVVTPIWKKISLTTFS